MTPPNSNMHRSSTGDLVKMQIWIQEIWGREWQSAFPTNSPGVTRLLIPSHTELYLVLSVYSLMKYKNVLQVVCKFLTLHPATLLFPLGNTCTRTTQTLPLPHTPVQNGQNKRSLKSLLPHEALQSFQKRIRKEGVEQSPAGFGGFPQRPYTQHNWNHNCLISWCRAHHCWDVKFHGLHTWVHIFLFVGSISSGRSHLFIYFKGTAFSIMSDEFSLSETYNAKSYDEAKKPQSQ